MAYEEYSKRELMELHAMIDYLVQDPIRDPDQTDIDPVQHLNAIESELEERGATNEELKEIYEELDEESHFDSPLSLNKCK